MFCFVYIMACPLPGLSSEKDIKHVHHSGSSTNRKIRVRSCAPYPNEINICPRVPPPRNSKWWSWWFPRWIRQRERIQLDSLQVLLQELVTAVSTSPFWHQLYLQLFRKLHHLSSSLVSRRNLLATPVSISTMNVPTISHNVRLKKFMLTKWQPIVRALSSMRMQYSSLGREESYEGSQILLPNEYSLQPPGFNQPHLLQTLQTATQVHHVHEQLPLS